MRPSLAECGNGKEGFQAREVVDLASDPREEDRIGDGLVNGRAAWDCARPWMPFARRGRDIGQAIKPQEKLATMVVYGDGAGRGS